MNANGTPIQQEPTYPCPMCSATGANRHGGPCSSCHGKGYVQGKLETTGALLSAIGSALIGLVFGAIALAVLIVIIVAAL